MIIFQKWILGKVGEKLILNRKFIVFDRKDYKIENNFSNDIKFINIDNSTSSSLVRQKIKDKGDFEKFILPEVASYINQEGLYK